ncbi:unnamed protein product [Caenorhabditis angaria]|uniref:SH3 domain-containing protein n=1 Tax=Caenorhabditis angaria TaxID=860376 RepID=A0A9P1N3F0_9PELO|nr:unnamed protein product [Caenorhabditis angaria]
MIRSQPPPVAPKPKIQVNQENIDTSTGFSVSAAKALFEAAKKPEAAKNVAQDEKARGAVLNAVKDPSAGNKFQAAFAVADVNRRAGDGPPPPPPHRDRNNAATTSSSSSVPSVPGKLSGTHSAIRSQLENLHLGGSTSAPAPVSPKYQSNNSIPPPLPSHNSSYKNSSSSTSSYMNSSSTSSSQSYNKPVTEPHGIAQYSYSALQSDELSFNVGDTILLRKKVDDQWFYGENSRTYQSGIVPSSYIQVMIPLAESYSNSSGAVCATALYDYNSGQPGDLIFSANQSIFVTSKINDEWLEGEVNGKSGIFPANFVTCDQIYRVPLKLTTPTYNKPSANLGTVKANYDYSSGVAADLQFAEGDTITILEDIDAQWIMGELNGLRGLAPKTFLGPPYGSPKKSPSKGIAEISTAFSPKKALAIADYHSDDPKHLYVTRGDHLLIVEDVDDYYFRGKLEAFKTLPAGILPKNVVQMSN